MTFPSFSAGEVLRAQDMNAVGTWLVKSQAVGSGVSSVVVTDAFSASYDNYLIQWTGGTQSVDTNLTLKLGAAGTNYYGALIHGSFFGGSPANAAQNGGTAFQWAGGGTSTSAMLSCMLFEPFAARPTHLQAFIRYSTVYGNNVGYQGDSTSFTAFTLAPASGTMTGGTIRIYGFQK
jgi:hypothetical protein